MIEYALFAGCLTGRRLKEALGEELCSKIVWQEANPTISTEPRRYFPPDIEHIKSVMEKHKPDIVLCLTKAGEEVIKLAVGNVRFVSCPHPASRAPDIIEQLKEAAKQII